MKKIISLSLITGAIFGAFSLIAFLFLSLLQNRGNTSDYLTFFFLEKPVSPALIVFMTFFILGSIIIYLNQKYG